MKRPLRSDAARALANVAIDLGDPGRMAKARRLYRSNAVSTIDLAPRLANANVSDSDGVVYDVTIELAPSAQAGEIPQSSDLEVSCTCEDTSDACRHGLAMVLGIAEGVEVDPQSIERWTETEADVAEVSLDSRAAEPNDDFFLGGWREPAPISITRLRSTEPSLVVDGVDAGPVVVDAIAAIADELSPRTR